MDLVALHCGDIRADAGLLYEGKRSDEHVVIPIMCFAITHPDGVVVFETGMNPEVRHDPVGYWGKIAQRVLVPILPESATVVERLAQIDLAPGDVRYVVNSHLHNDHAGMNRHFADATVLVRRREFDHACTLMDAPNTGYVRGDFHGDDVELMDYDDTYDLFGDGSVVLVSTVGHSPGHQSLRVRFPSGQAFVLSGDALYQRASLCTGCPPGLVWDRPLAEASVQRLAAMDMAGDTVLVNHDPESWSSCSATQLLHRERGRA